MVLNKQPLKNKWISMVILGFAVRVLIPKANRFWLLTDLGD